MKATIVALCFNHEEFLDEALSSLEKLDEQVFEIIVVDDASQDLSPEILKKWKEVKPNWKFIFHIENQGNCKAFNQALSHCKGEWILDFATDDVLIPEVFEEWIDYASFKGEIGFCYADAFIFSRKRESNYLFSRTLGKKKMPEGRILSQLFEQNFICPPAVLFSTQKLKQLGGYSENLAYEDWDAWLRLSREHEVAFFAKPVIFYRKHQASMSASLFQKRNEKLLNSTTDILEKTLQWPEIQGIDKNVICHFISYHIRLCFLLQLPEPAKKFGSILKRELGFLPISSRGFLFFSDKLPFVYPIFKWLKA